MQSIDALIEQQLDINKSKNLLYKNVTQIMSVEPSFLAALEELLNSNGGDKSEEIHSEFISFAAKELVKRLYSINPYLRVSKVQVGNLEQIYHRTWQRMIKTGNIKTTLNEFNYPELSKWLAALYPEKFQQSLKFTSGIGHVTYEEYSAELQIELLGIDIARIKQPVIDIGCGSQANLVKYFRSLDVEAYGIDRQLVEHESYLTQVDWFDFYFEPGRWGTVISNMGFTNHLNYAYLQDISQLEHYLLKMREIIESLSVYGCFYYAPGLPYIEDKLSAKSYTVERRQKISDVTISIIMRTDRS
jgi:hypothetical protein